MRRMTAVECDVAIYLPPNPIFMFDFDSDGQSTPPSGPAQARRQAKPRRLVLLPPSILMWGSELQGGR
jgi:hypothetical protein